MSGIMKEGLFPEILRGPSKYFVGGLKQFFLVFFLNFIGFLFRKVAKIDGFDHQITFKHAWRGS